MLPFKSLLKLKLSFVVYIKHNWSKSTSVANQPISVTSRLLLKIHRIMSFFGFDTPGHNQGAPGFSQGHNPFAGLSNRDNDADVIDFDDTYDGLGDQLQESGDAFNDDTFGDTTGQTTAAVGKDFDFAGRTAQVSNAMEEEHALLDRKQGPTKPSQAHPSGFPASVHYQPHPAYRPERTGYEQYNKGDLQVDADLWGVAPKKQATPAVSAPSQPPGGSRKILSLEEVEAQMRAQHAPSQPAPVFQAQPPVQHAARFDSPHQNIRPEQPHHQYSHGDPRPQDQQAAHGQPVTILQRPQSKQAQQPQQAQPPQVTAHQRHPSSGPMHPTQILQNPHRQTPGGYQQAPPFGQPHPAQFLQGAGGPAPGGPGPDYGQGHIITHPSQLAQLSENEKTAYLDQEAKRAKRNHKIYLMSRDNGIMTPQDKNFVTRIQLQQLVSATGNPNDHGTDESLAEDFYYQVHSQIQGGHRQNPNQPLNNFAQTYLFQTGSRQGGFRRQNRGPDNHMQRMEQQVQRAVEAAKNKPKNKQLVIEGSLGKISFSNAKTPKPLLNIKRDSSHDVRPSSAHRATNVNIDVRKRELRSIEQVYATLMKIEDHDRNMPAPPASEADTEGIERFMNWRNEAQQLNDQLWTALRVHDQPEQGQIHPFISLLSYGKAKKAMPRIFRHISPEQRTTILTLIIVSLDNLDIIRGAQTNTGDTRLNAAMRENIDLFSNTVLPTLFNFMNELGLDLVAGILGLICTRNVDVIAKSRVGVSLLTMILSRAELIRQSGAGNQADWQSWYASVYLFSVSYLC